MIFTSGGERYMVGNSGRLLRWHEWPNDRGCWVFADSVRIPHFR